ncbi:dihydrofolate reductase [Sphingobacteriaceae bacterium]|nr:dihydrofolate reductase [Sphingobacteriaceae bacterium]
MRKIVAAINTTIDGFCDHEAGIPDEETHEYYQDLLNGADVALYGRITYQLMQFWQELIKKPSGEKAMDDFAVAIDRIPKIVFSNTFKSTEALGWNTASLSVQTIEQTVLDLKKQDGRDILIGSRSIMVQLTNLNLIDEYQICVHPVIIGKGKPLFEKLNDRKIFKLYNTKIFKSGAIMLYYKRGDESKG